MPEGAVVGAAVASAAGDAAAQATSAAQGAALAASDASSATAATAKAAAGGLADAVSGAVGSAHLAGESLKGNAAAQAESLMGSAAAQAENLMGGAAQAKSAMESGGAQAQSLMQGGRAKAQSLMEDGGANAQGWMDGMAAKSQNLMSGGTAQAQALMSGGAAQAQGFMGGGAAQAQNLMSGGAVQAQSLMSGGAAQAQNLMSGAAQAQNLMSGGAAQAQGLAQRLMSTGGLQAQGMMGVGAAQAQGLMGSLSSNLSDSSNLAQSLLPGVVPGNGMPSVGDPEAYMSMLVKSGAANSGLLGVMDAAADFSPRDSGRILTRDMSSLAAGAFGMTGFPQGITQIQNNRPPAPPTASPGDGSQPMQPQTSAPPDKQRFEMQERELEKLRVQTMHGMATQVQLTVGNVPMSCSFVYLSNNSISMMTKSSMPLVASELGLKDFRQIIRLMPARCGTMGWNACSFWDYKFPFRKKPEVNQVEREKSEHQLLLLARHLLKLAVDTNALVIGNDSCALVEAFLRVAAPVQCQYKDNCPFKLLIFARAFMCHKTATEDADTVAKQFYKKCKFWNQSRADFEKAMKKRFGDDTAWWPRQELYSGEYSMIMFECVDHQKQELTEQVFSQFQNDFMAAYGHLPVVALQMYGQWKFMANAHAIRDFVDQGNQLLLLDSRDRKQYENMPLPEEDEHFAWQLPGDLREEIREIPELNSAFEDLQKFSALLHTQADGGPRMDQYDAGALAIIKQKVCSGQAAQNNDSDIIGQRNMWLWEAIVRKTQQKDHDMRKNAKDSEWKAKRQQHLIAAARLLMMYLGNELQWESRMRHKHCKECIAKIRSSSTWDELTQNLQLGTSGYRFLFHWHKDMEEFVKKHEAWFELQINKKATPHGTTQLIVKPEEGRRQYANGDNLATAKEAVAAFLGAAQEFGEKRFGPGESMLRFAADEEKWLAIFDLIKSPYVRTGNLHDLKNIEHTLQQMAVTDRLPKENSMEALLLIRRAWTLVDIFKVQGIWYKWISKAAYLFLLLVGIAIVVITVLTANAKNTDHEFDEDHSGRLLLIVSLVGSFVTGVVTMLDPTRKWLQLRGAQLGLESEIWQFRTRSGEYMSTATMALGRNEEEHRAATLFKQSMLMTHGKLQQSAGLNDTSFFALQTATDDPEDTFNVEEEVHENSSNVSVRTKSTKIAWEHRTKRLKRMEKKVKFVHRQYNPNFVQDLLKLHDVEAGKAALDGVRPLEGHDNHHSPVDSENYIRWRMMPSLEYYRSQIPVYARRRRAFQALILLSSIAVACLAALELGEWSAIVSSVAVALAAWQEFVGYAKKLERYSSVAAALENHLTWWQSLRPTDKLNAQIQNELVKQTEELLTSEHSAWMSDAQQAAKMLKAQSVSVAGGSAQRNSGRAESNGGGKKDA